MGERFWQGLGRGLNLLLIGMTYLDPMALTAYHVAVAQTGASQDKDQTRARLDRLAGERASWAAKPTTGPIAGAGLSKSIRTASAAVSAEVV
jgi:hypothetical protein